MGNIEKQKLLVIDGSAILHRAFHALPPFTAPDGTPTNALFGFAKMLLSLVDQVKPEYLTVCFDSPVPTFRKKLLATYQSQRPKTPDEYKVQVPLTQKFLDKANIAHFFLAGFEADDVIGSLVRSAEKENPDLSVYVVTGDKDLFQLVNRQTTVLVPRSGVSNVLYMDSAAVKAKMGIEPAQIIDYKALVGDPSDNYGGIKGIGPKRATDLLLKYGSVENIYNHMDDIDEKTKNLLLEHRSDALLSQELATIKTDLDLGVGLDRLRLNIQKPSSELSEFLNSLSLQSIKNQLYRTKPLQKAVPVPVKKKDNQLSFF